MMWDRFRYAARQLWKSPAFSITVIATLALCIGANTAIYSLVDALFFRPLAYPQADRLVLLTTVAHASEATEVDTSQDGTRWELVRDHASLLDSAVYGGGNGVNLVAGGRVEYVQDQRVGAHYFRVLGVKPLIGRDFSRAEDVPNGPPVAVLSYGLWQRLYHGDRSVVGRSIDLRGTPYTVVGVMQQGFRSLPGGLSGDVPPDVWTPLRATTTGEGGGDNYGVIGRLKPGVTLAEVNGQLNSVMHDVLKRMQQGHPISVEERAIPLQSGITYDLRSRVHLMWGAVGLVLLIGCVNIAGILLARSAARTRELATRLALGARRGQVVSELFAEAVLLAVAGGIVGLGLGELGLWGLLRLNPGEFTLAGPVHMDGRVMAVMIALSLATSLIFGLFPAVEASRVDLRSVLAEAGRGSAGSKRQWKRQSLVFAEVALSVVLVIAAGLLIRTFLVLADASPGFDTHHLTIASASMNDARYAKAAAGARLFRESVAAIERIPGVESAAVALSSPYGRPLNESFTLAGDRDAKQRITELTYATPGIFETLRMKVLRGRAFTSGDREHSANVAVANETFVSRYLKNERDPIGTAVKIEGKNWTIVGVVNDVQEKNGIGLGGPIDRFPELYVPADQFPDEVFAMANVWFSPVWMVRTHGDDPKLAEGMQSALASIDPQLPFSSFKTVANLRGSAFQQQRYQAAIFSTLAGLGVLLAVLGLYGLIAHSVAQRTREIGIRLALGATVRQVVWSAALPGMALAAAGVATGVVLALFATRLLGAMIWGVTPNDPLTFIAVSVLLVGVAAVASIVPALRLSRIDPAQTLRDE